MLRILSILAILLLAGCADNDPEPMTHEPTAEAEGRGLSGGPSQDGALGEEGQDGLSNETDPSSFEHENEPASEDRSERSGNSISLQMDPDGQAAYAVLDIPAGSQILTYRLDHVTADRLAVAVIEGDQRIVDAQIDELDPGCGGDDRNMPLLGASFGSGAIDIQGWQHDGQVVVVAAGSSSAPEMVSVVFGFDAAPDVEPVPLPILGQGEGFVHEKASMIRCQSGQSFTMGSIQWAYSSGIERPAAQSASSSMVDEESMHVMTSSMGSGYEMISASYTATRALGSYVYQVGEETKSGDHLGDHMDVSWAQEGLREDAGSHRFDVEVVRQGASAFAFETMVWPFDLASLDSEVS